MSFVFIMVLTLLLFDQILSKRWCREMDWEVMKKSLDDFQRVTDFKTRTISQYLIVFNRFGYS
jgi:hypothetical protein